MATMPTLTAKDATTPDVASMTQEERIAARRARVQRRYAAVTGASAGSTSSSDDNDSHTTVACTDGGGGNGDVDALAGVTDETQQQQRAAAATSVTRGAMPHGEQRAQQACEAMVDAQHDAVESIAEAVVRTTAAEGERRARSEAEARARLSSCALEQNESDAQLGALRMRFEALYAHTVAHELHSDLDAQRAQCAQLVESKERLLRELAAQLQDKNAEYVQQLRQNAQSIDDMLRAMRAVAEAYVDRYARELAEVERVYEQERRSYVEQCGNEIQQLVRTRRTRETDYRKRREQCVVEAQQQLETKHEDTYEDYNDTKRSEQAQIYAMQHELEKCKADFMLNGERLSYNLQVLRERVKENKSAQNQYKRKLARLQNTLSTLITRHGEAEARYQRANKELTAQLRRVGAQYKDVQHKFQLFETADRDKYRQVWRTHDRRCRRLVHRCLQADRVVFEDVLRMPWQPPEMTFWPEEQEDLDAVDDDDDSSSSSDDDNDSSSSNNSDSEGEKSEQDERAQQQPVAAGGVAMRHALPRGRGHGGGGAGAATADLELSEAAQMLLHILHMQASFLVDADVYEAVRQIQGTTEEQARLEGVLTTLKIRKTREVQDLLEYFTLESDDGAVALIHPQECVRALNAYLTERAAQQASKRERRLRRRQRRRGASGDGAAASSTARVDDGGDAGKHKSRRARYEARHRLAERNYWQQLAKAVSPEHLQVWDALEKGMEQYLAQLHQRRALIADTDTLRARNDELRGLLQQYMQSDINFQLYTAPRLVNNTHNE